MSRIGKKPIPIPAGVDVAVNGGHVTVKGKLGTLERDIHPLIEVSKEENQIVCKRTKSRDKRIAGLWGLSRTLIKNMVLGVSEGYSKEMEIIGVGYRAQVSGSKLTLSLGFSHPVEFDIPKGVTVSVDRNTQLKVSGADKEVIGQICANIRSYRPPEPYKGKGVRYKDEEVLRKEGKKK
ncbi:50S ribosomal protein L6 [Magnetococcales bacterium HHB-1]